MQVSTPQRHSAWRDDIGKVLRVVLPLCVSAGLVIWMFHKVDIGRVRAILSQGVDYRYLVVMMLLTMLSYIFRGIRWGIQLRAAGIPRISPVAESVSIFGAYALNLLVPYLGECWRCVYITRIRPCKLSTVVGTDFGDRISDAVVVLLLLGLTLVVARPELSRFLDRYPIGEDIARYTTDGTLLVWLGVGALVLVGADYALRHTRFVQGVNTSLRRIWDGFAVLFHMRGTGMYIVLTVGIWGCYFLNMYVCFFAFPFTRTLIDAPGMAGGLIPALVAFLFGSFSIAIPSNGGLGPWNIAVMFALTLFGISQADGAAYSIMCWSFQTVMIIILGVFSAFYVMLGRHRHPRAPRSNPTPPSHS